MPTVTRSEQLNVEGLKVTMTIVPDDNGRSDTASTVELQVRWNCPKCKGDRAATRCVPHCANGQDIKTVAELAPIIGEHMTDQVRRALQEALGAKRHAPPQRQDL